MGAVYQGVAGAKREMASAKVGIGGAVRDVGEIYAGVDGVRRLVWQKAHPGSVTLWWYGEDYLTSDTMVMRLKGAVAEFKSNGEVYLTWEDEEGANIEELMWMEDWFYSSGLDCYGQVMHNHDYWYIFERYNRI